MRSGFGGGGAGSADFVDSLLVKDDCTARLMAAIIKPWQCSRDCVVNEITCSSNRYDASFS